MTLALMEDRVWQMSPGERAAVEGILGELRPALAIEIGSAEGAGLRRIASFAEEVHSFDLEPPSLEPPANVVLHTGDSHELLPTFLAELAEAGRNVDFTLVDGDHSETGARADVEALLGSPATSRTVIVIHDTANEDVRRGLDAVRYRAFPKVAYVDLDFVPGRLCRFEGLRHELWYGLGLVIVDASRPAYVEPGLAPPLHGYLVGRPLEFRFYEVPPVLAAVRDAIAAHEAVKGSEAEPEDIAALGGELVTQRARAETLKAALAEITSSPSWRITAPLRAAKARAAALAAPLRKRR